MPGGDEMRVYYSWSGSSRGGEGNEGVQGNRRATQGKGSMCKWSAAMSRRGMCQTRMFRGGDVAAL